MDYLRTRTTKWRVWRKTWKLFWNRFHRTWTSCSRRPWCLLSFSKWVAVQRESQLKTSWPWYSSPRTSCKEDGFTRILSVSCPVLEKLNVKKPNKFWTEKHYSSIACYPKKRGKVFQSKFSLISSRRNSSNKKNVLKHFHLWNWAWLHSLKEKKKLL